MAKKKTDKGHLGKAKGNNITLDFDAKIVSPDVFKKAIGAFVELLKAVSDEAVGTGRKSSGIWAWIKEAVESSPARFRILRQFAQAVL
jgi:hypothetical protein